MTIVASVINKNKLSGSVDLYALALRFCLESVMLFLKENGQEDKLTHIIFECRGAREDKDLELEFRRLCDKGGQFGKIDYLDILFVDKKANLAGLQIADLMARPIGLNALRPDQNNRAYEVIKNKFWSNGDGKIEGFGLKVFP